MGRAVTRVQTGIRLDSDLRDRLKVKARVEGRSFNNYVERILSKAVYTSYPNLSEITVSDDILSLGEVLPRYSAEEIAVDDRLSYLLSK